MVDIKSAKELLTNKSYVRKVLSHLPDHARILAIAFTLGSTVSIHGNEYLIIGYYVPADPAIPASGILLQSILNSDCAVALAMNCTFIRYSDRITPDFVRSIFAEQPN